MVTLVTTEGLTSVGDPYETDAVTRDVQITFDCADPDDVMESGFNTLRDPEGNEFCLD